MQFKGVHRPLPEIAHELNVDGVLEGSVSRSPEGVHLTLQLIRADTDTHLWAESYDRNPDQVSGLAGEAARDIAARLHSSTLAPAVVRYVRPDAHDAYLRGRYLWFEGDNTEAGKAFMQAVQLQPDYALGWMSVAEYYGVESFAAPPLEVLPLAEADAQKAVDLDNQLPEAHQALGAAILVNRWDWERSLKELNRAIELDPKFADAYHFRARIFAALGRNQEAIASQKQATELDPFLRPWGMAETYNWARQYDAAIADARLRLKSSKDLLPTMAYSYRCKGMGKEAAEAWAEQATRLGDDRSAASIRHAFQLGGYKAVVQWQLADLERTSKTSYVSPVKLALLQAQLGDREKTIALLEQGLREHSPNLLWIQCDPAFDFLHADVRYRAIIQRIGLPLFD